MYIETKNGMQTDFFEYLYIFFHEMDGQPPTLTFCSGDVYFCYFKQYTIDNHNI